MMEEQEKVLYVLNISSWKGISIGAEHFYGELLKITYPEITVDNIDEYGVDSFSDNKIKIQKRISRRDAIEFNKKDTWGIKYKPGEFTDRFDTPDQLIEHTRKKYLRGKMKDIPFVVLLHGEKYEAKSNPTHP